MLLFRFRVLDEVDRMMQMGFIDDVETILKAAEERKVRGCSLQGTLGTPSPLRQ